MATKVKGIRVNQLARELGITSKAILDRCKSEGLGDKVPNHMSLMTFGLAETVREWFASAGATAVATATEEEPAEAKPKPRRRKKAEAPGEAAAPAAAPAADAPAPLVKEVPPAEAPAPTQQVPPPPAAPAPAVTEAAPPVVEAPAAPQPPPVTPLPAPAAPVAPPEAPTVAAAAAAPAAVPEMQVPAAPPVKERKPAAKRPAARAPAAPPKPQRQPITPAPKLVVPAPAKIQGPRIVREEQPDVVPTPRKRLAPGPTSPPSFVQARPQGGRGVKARDDEVEETTEARKPGKGSGRTLSSRRRGPDGRRGEALEKLREWSEADLIERRDRLNAAASYRAGFDLEMKKKAERGQHLVRQIQRGQKVSVEEPLTIKNLSSAMGIKSNEILVKLMKQGVMTNVNASLDRDTAQALAMEYGIDLDVKAQATAEEELEQELAMRQPDPEKMSVRPPIVTILGHVDHGKTSLLDKIRKANVAAGEAGGITQHIAAWTVQLGDKRVTFIDTPGHQAFTSMRARGANMTDVVVLVVSAAEGVQPQTIESINHAKAAEVPIVVAMNKIDRSDSNPDMVLRQLAAQGLNPTEWGGDTEVVRTSAVTGQGIEELIEVLDYQSQLLELKSDPAAPARGTVIESRVDEGLGAVATVLVQDGTLHVGDNVLAGSAFGRVRSLVNDRGEMVEEAGPATPVIISGLDELPMVGERFYSIDDLETARSIAEQRKASSRESQLATQNRVTAENLLSNIAASNVKTINLIVKGDVQGSVETLAKTVTDYNTDEVKVKVIHAGVGAINESDVELAAATRDEQSSTVIIGFHVVPDEAARQLAEQRHVEIRLYKVIYEIFDDLKKALSGMLEPEVREKLHGHAEIRQVFKVSRVGNVAGCMVTDGHIQRGSKIRLIRNDAVIAEDLSLESLKRMKDDVREVKAGFECGLKIAGYDDIKIGDRLEAYSRELIRRTL